MPRFSHGAWLMALCLAAPFASAEHPTPGSVLIFPIHRAGQGFTTIVTVTNTNTQQQTPTGFGGSTRLHYEYVNTVHNPQNPFQPQHCSVDNAGAFLTPADTLSVSTRCHNAGSSSSGGFLVVSALSPTGGVWSHNFLVGSEIVVTSAGATYALNAIALGAVPPAGALTDANFNGRLDFDGIEYEGVPDLLYIDSFLALADSNLVLANLTATLHGIHTARFTIWNDNEFPLSATKAFRCWFAEPLRNISAAFTEQFLRNNTPHDPDELDVNCSGIGRLETGWARIDSAGVVSTGGFFIDADGAMVGAIVSPPGPHLDFGKLLFGSETRQTNGSAFEF
jgi:hypothetical protein